MKAREQHPLVGSNCLLSTENTAILCPCAHSIWNVGSIENVSKNVLLPEPRVENEAPKRTLLTSQVYSGCFHYREIDSSHHTKTFIYASFTVIPLPKHFSSYAFSLFKES